MKIEIGRSLSLPFLQQILLTIFSLIIVAFGQPAWFWWCGLLAAAGGYALFWRVLLSIEGLRHRFALATLWYFAVQAIDTSWLLSHPFWYIYAVWGFLALGCALQFGLVSLLVTGGRILQLHYLVIIAASWTIMEWSRLFFMSGYSWNPAGLALTGHLYPLQMASLWGVYGFSFWIVLVNLLLLRAWLIHIKFQKSVFGSPFLLWVIAAIIPYVFGAFHFTVHEGAFAKYQQGSGSNLAVILVQPAFLPEESLIFNDPQGAVVHVIEEWKQILSILSKQIDQKVDLIALPEFVVPFGTYTPIYPYETMRSAFEEFFGDHGLRSLPPLEDPWAGVIYKENGSPLWLVNNAFMAQALSSLFQAELVVGLEDADYISPKQKAFYSAAICFHPNGKSEERYEKRVLVPMAEYIPFSFCKELAATYGISGSFSPGTEAKVFHAANVPFMCCVCYEETFGNMMREGRQLGAELLVNVTSDVWFPNSRLPQQHFDHARLRTVECGIPLVRACNTGVTCVIDSLGRVVATLGEGDKHAEWLSDVLHIDVPLYTYQTFYSRWGDRPIIGFCILSLLLIPFSLRKI